MTRRDLVSGISLEGLILGIWRRRTEDLRRYGRGGFAVDEYASTLLKESVTESLCLYKPCVPRMNDIFFASLKRDLIDLALAN